ncbi:hypothetical protein Elgi_38430 [Paenibacillus elgii]|uniref:hypothetical protein n=1 Tax=Paenibacillus elgii TaxID=189691 RepID=UPI002D7DC6B1|nr:hypothetical protein Elgi_38430 [Paenibacillus elgii]
MKYCTYCHKVYNDEIIECTCQTKYTWTRYGEIKTLPIEAKCKKCDSIIDLEYREPWSSGSYTYGNYCTCAACIDKANKEQERQEAMKYLVIDNYGDETCFCNNKEEVEVFLEEFTRDEPWDRKDIVNQDILILKLEELDRVDAKDFKDPKNTHVVVWNNELYRVEEVIQPEMECEGDYSINW